MLSRLKNHDWLITIIATILLLLSLTVIYSATINKPVGEESQALLLTKQLIFIVVGLLAYFAISLIDFSWFKNPSILAMLYFVILALLIFVKISGTTIAGTNRWINFGFFSLQPSEYAKIILILTTVGIFTISSQVLEGTEIKFSAPKNKKKLRGVIATGKMLFQEFAERYPLLEKLLLSAAVAAPIVLLIIIQPALGTGIITFTLWLLLIIVVFPDHIRLFAYMALAALGAIIIFNYLSIEKIAEVYTISINSNLNPALLAIATLMLILVTWLSKLKWQIAIGALMMTSTIVFGFIFSWNQGLIDDYQKERIEVFVSGPESDPTNGGYQVIQSVIAVGSGRLQGRGFLEGTQSSLNILTQAYNDFAFATLAEQFGFIGSLLLLGLYLALILRIIKVGQLSPDPFNKYVCIGVAMLLLVHIFINIGMNMGKLPVTGIPLPLVSYGGSSVFVNLISLGLVQSIARSIRPVDIADNLMLTSHELILR